MGRLLGDTPAYTTNLERGDDGAHVYWRVLWALEDDPLVSMLNAKVLKGLASAIQDGMTDGDNVAKFSSTAVRPFVKDVLEASPLSILSIQAHRHIANVVFDSFFPELED